jgi:hypothetical protein
MILTHAISGIARSGATRSGYPVLLGHKVPLYALSNVARSGATRSNYVSSKAFINIGGIDYGWGATGYPGVLAESLTKSDAINNTPVTVAFTARGWVPVEGTDVVITLGSKNNLRREFGGTILSTRHRYVGDKPVVANMLYDASCIDYTWGLDRRKASGSYVNASVAAIAASLLTFAPAGYTLQVDADIGAEILDAMTVTEQTLSSAFTQLAQRVGGSFLCDYSKVVHLCYDTAAIAPPPAIVNAVHASMAGITFTRDLSQVITRCLGSFGGSNALEQIAPGATLLPVETAAWYLAQGGTVLVAQQRVNYSGLVVGGGGSLVGPGAAPTGAPNASLLPGVGVDLGSHDYAVTFKTTSGESIPGPRITVPVGLFLAPGSAPAVGAPGPGTSGPDPGVHDYAVSFVISGGETVPGPRVTASTGLTDAPTTGPTPDAVNAGTGPDDGTHDYAVTFGTATGETPPGPIGGQITTGTYAPPVSAVGFGAGLPLPPTAGALPAGSYDYAVTLVTAAGGETTVGPLATVSLVAVNAGNVPVAPPSTAPTLTEMPGSDGWVPGQTIYVAITFIGATGETTAGPKGSVTPQRPQNANQINVSNIPVGPPGTTARWMYQGSGVSGNVYGPYVVSGNVATTSVVPNSNISNLYSSSGQYGPLTNTATVPNMATPTVPILNLPITSDARIVGKRLYRRVTGPAAFQLVRQFDPTVGQFGITAPPLGTMIIYVSGSGPGPLSVGAYSYKVTLVTAEGETEGSLATNVVSISNPAAAGRIDVYNMPIPRADSGVTSKRLYRTVANGSAWKLVATLTPATDFYNDAIPDSSLGAAVPVTNTTGDRVALPGAAAPNTSTAYLRAVHIPDIPRGATGTTARKLYRRSAGAGLRLVATIPDNSSAAYTDTTSNAALGAAPPAANTAYLRVISLSAIPLGNSLVTARKVYRTPANTGGGTLKLVATIADNVTTVLTDTVVDAALGAAALTVGTAQAAQVQLSAIPIGAPAVTARVIYRTKAGLSQLQLLTTIADNVTAAWLDVAADASLGANAPTSDTSLLTQPAGNVFAGSPSLPCASVAGFLPSGGWAIAGAQNIRYTGISGTNLVGIPASGPGAISATLSYNTTIVAAAMLIGIPTTGLGVIKYTILKGDPVNLFVQVDDLDAQAAVRAQLPGSDGIIEDEIQDGRLGYLEGVSRCQARLDLLGARDSEGKVGIVTVSYVCRDVNTHAGATATVNLGPPINLRGDYLIQRVNVTQFNVPNLNPTYTVEASSIRFSAEEMLRLLRQGAM